VVESNSVGNLQIETTASTIQPGTAVTLLSPDAVPLWIFSGLLGIGTASSISISGMVCAGYVAVLERIRSTRDPVDGSSPHAANDLQLPAPPKTIEVWEWMTIDEEFRTP
jgi:hypothetical protein